MLILHGIYDNGKIEIEEKDLPKGKAKVEIKLDIPPEETVAAGLGSILGKYHFGKRLDKVNIRDIIYD